MKKKASEFRDSLVALGSINEDDIERIVKSAVEKGDLEDDLTTPQPTMADIDAVAERIAKSLAVSEEETVAKSAAAEPPAAKEALTKHEGETFIDVAETLTSIVKSVNGLRDEVVAGRGAGMSRDTFAKSMGAMAELTLMTARSVERLAEMVRKGQERDDEIVKALKLPVPPRSAGNLKVVPAPGDVTEDVVAKSASAEADAAITGENVAKAIQAEIAEIRKAGGRDPQTLARHEALTVAEASLTAGGNPASIVENFSIKVG